MGTRVSEEATIVPMVLQLEPSLPSKSSTIYSIV